MNYLAQAKMSYKRIRTHLARGISSQEIVKPMFMQAIYLYLLTDPHDPSKLYCTDKICLDHTENIKSTPSVQEQDNTLTHQLIYIV